jgi:GT2 family glycosyltransferase
MTPRADSIAIVVLTHNRVHLLRQCVENVLARASEATTEIVIWDNASTDGTAEYLATISDPRIRVVAHPRNIGLNAYAIVFPQTRAEYLLELDDDVVDAPGDWDRDLLTAYRALPEIGYLQAKLADDGHSPGADLLYRINKDVYKPAVVNGVRLLVDGPVGGGCTITSRELHDRVGGFRRSRKAFYREDQLYIESIRKLGYRAAILDEVVVVHHGGPYYAPLPPEKVAFYARRKKMIARKQAVKRALLAVPFVSPLNRRYRWFEPPESAPR